MKINTPQFVLRAGLLGAALSMYAASPSFAAPRDRGDRRDVAEARRDLERERRDSRRDDRRDGNWNRPGNRYGNRPGYRPGYNGNGYGYNGNGYGYNGNGYGYNGNGYGYNGNGYGHNGNGYGYNGNGNGYNGNGYNGNGYNGGYGYTGVVTKVRSNQSFDIRVDGTTYNVYTNGRLPRGLNTGDTVRVNGVRTDNNDIRNASVSLLSNR